MCACLPRDVMGLVNDVAENIGYKKSRVLRHYLVFSHMITK